MTKEVRFGSPGARDIASKLLQQTFNPDEDLNINRNIGILKEKYVVGLDYILNLDIIEARHQLDNLVCYSGLKDTTFFDLQKGLQVKPTLQQYQNQSQVVGWRVPEEY